MATETHPEWGYAGEIGPDRWGCLSSDYNLCSAGVEQSPVNLAGYVSGGTETVTFDYTTVAVQARNNGHTVYLDFDPGSGVSVGRRRYELLGVHYHSPGEHLLDGETFAAELHLVHQDADGNLAVVGLLFRLGNPSPLVEDLLGLAPATGVEADVGGGPNAAEYEPSHSGYYGYRGSLTTPPCSEGVRWMVMQSIGTVSADQVDILQSLTHGPNNRPPQPIGDRQITVSDGG